MDCQKELPGALGSLRAVDVLFKALAAGRLPHGILLYGGSAKTLDLVCQALSSEILGMPAVKSIDFHAIRPSNKIRRISMDSMSELCRELQLAPSFGDKKVACVYEADRLGKDAANAFLKTLEEPPAGTHIFLLTTAINQVLPTILSRTLHFRIPGEDCIEDEDWTQWRADFEKWILGLTQNEVRTHGIDRAIFSVYSLTARFQALVKKIAEKEWKHLEADLSPNLSEDQLEAISVGNERGVRRQLLIEMQESLLKLSLAYGTANPLVHPVALSCYELERAARLLELNMQDGSVLENFLLKCLRLWSGK
ncbi:MAG: hypothetical protein K6B46_04890 [Opitutales bacterium]|nr:hypothetical protein [Opitutales bacterium]